MASGDTLDDHGLEVIRKAGVDLDLTKTKYAIRVILPAGTTIDAIPSGLTVAGKVTEVTLNSATWTALPATALTDRNAIRVQNPVGNVEIKINYSSLIVGYVGMVVGPGGEVYYDITDSIILYAKSSSGTPTVNVEELS